MTRSTLHDRLFKEFLHRFLPDFLTLFFPDKAAQLDFTTLTFLDKELIINLPNQILRIPDVVAEVQTIMGQPEMVIVHVEVEGRNKNTLSQRIFEYYALLQILRQKPILPIVLVLLPGVGGIRWQIYRQHLFGQELLRFRYGQIGLRDLSGQDYVNMGHPIAATLAVLMKCPRQYKAALKLKALQTVINSSLDIADQLYLFSLIETYLPKEVISLGDDNTMTQLAEIELTWPERLFFESEARGKTQGKRDLLLRLLALKFGPLPTHLLIQIQAINDEPTFDRLSELLLTASNLPDFLAQAALNPETLSPC